MNNIGKISAFIILFSSSFSHALDEHALTDVTPTDVNSVVSELQKVAAPSQAWLSEKFKNTVAAIREQVSQNSPEVTSEVPASPVVHVPVVEGAVQVSTGAITAVPTPESEVVAAPKKAAAKSWISIRKPTAKELQRYGLGVAVVVVIGTVTFILYKYGAFKAVYKKAQQRPVVTASTVVATVALMGTIFALYKNNVKPADMAKYLPNVNALTKKLFGSKAAALHMA